MSNILNESEGYNDIPRVVAKHSVVSKKIVEKKINETYASWSIHLVIERPADMNETEMKSFVIDAITSKDPDMDVEVTQASQLS
jgi:hypothetical protein